MGALTLKGYSFRGRPWEIETKSGVDVLDSMLGNIKLNYIGLNLQRIVPEYSLDLMKDNWITDKIRFCVDGLKRQRLLYPAVIRGGKIFRVSWAKVFWNLLNHVDKSNKGISVVLGNLLSLESIYLSKVLSSQLGMRLYRKNSIRSDYLLEAPLDSYGVGVLVGSNLRKELPLLYYGLRRGERMHGLKLLNFGINSKGYKGISIGNSVKSLFKFLSGKLEESSYLNLNVNKFMIVGENVSRKYGRLPFYSKLNVKYLELQIFSSGIIREELGLGSKFLSSSSGVLYVLGSDIIERLKRVKGSLVVYQGHHIGSILNRVNILFPSRVFLEADGNYLGLNGKLKSMERNLGPKDVYSDWEIIRLVSSYIVEFNNIVNFSLKKELSRDLLLNDLEISSKICIAGEVKLSRGKIYDIVSSFYEMDLLSKASKWLNNKRRLD